MYPSMASSRSLGMKSQAAFCSRKYERIDCADPRSMPKAHSQAMMSSSFWSSFSISSRRKVAMFMFPNPVKRWVYFTGKLLASLLTMFFVLSVFYVVVSLLTIWHSQSFSDLTYRSFGLSLLYSVAAVGVGYLVSAVMKGATGALVFTFAILFLIFPILDGVLSFAGAKPVFSVTFAAEAISYIMFILATR